MGVGHRTRGAAVPDRPNRNEQRRARELAGQEGISYQQALQRLRDDPRPAASDVFASTHMAQILALARREADLLGHGRDVVTECVLLALIWDGSGPATALTDLGVRDVVDTRVRELVALPAYRPNRDDMATVMRHVRHYMDAYGHDEMGADHTLAAMTHLQTGVIAQVLDELELREALCARMTPWLRRRAAAESVD